jgi:hypothetical protein
MDLGGTKVLGQVPFSAYSFKLSSIFKFKNITHLTLYRNLARPLQTMTRLEVCVHDLEQDIRSLKYLGQIPCHQPFY